VNGESSTREIEGLSKRISEAFSEIEEADEDATGVIVGASSPAVSEVTDEFP
jgi:hypothetical protein